jgi:hypothetical protein
MRLQYGCMYNRLQSLGMCRHRMCGGEYDYYDIDDHVLVEAHFIPGQRRQYRNGKLAHTCN